MREIAGQFALFHKRGTCVRLARSLGRPLRYFLAKLVDGPCLIVAERIDEIADWLVSAGLADQFHPSYTRMVPAHHIVELTLIGCPDPNPRNTRFFAPTRNRWTTDLDDIGERYISTLDRSLDRWLDAIPQREPLGVLFSGGIDSGAVLLVLYKRLLDRANLPRGSRRSRFLSMVGGRTRIRHASSCDARASKCCWKWSTFPPKHFR